MHLITSTGRSGTTFLMLIYVFLKFNTGFTTDNFDKYIFKNCNAGLEFGMHHIQHYPNLEVVKNPWFMNNLNVIAERYKIEYLITPLRNFVDSANSRVKYKNLAGGLTGNATDVDSQVEV